MRRGGPRRRGRSTQPRATTSWDWEQEKKSGRRREKPSGCSPGDPCINTGSSHQLWGTGPVGLCLSVTLFKMEILMAAT